MPTTTTTCPGCGATLNADYTPGQITYVTCAYCNNRVAVTAPGIHEAAPAAAPAADPARVRRAAMALAASRRVRDHRRCCGGPDVPGKRPPGRDRRRVHHPRNRGPICHDSLLWQPHHASGKPDDHQGQDRDRDLRPMQADDQEREPQLALDDPGRIRGFDGHD